MKNKRKNYNFLCMIVGSIVACLLSVYMCLELSEMEYKQYFWVVLIISVITFLSVICCVSIHNSLTKYDSMTNIGSVNWIMRTGGKMYFQKKLHNYTAVFLNMKDSNYVNERFGNAAGDRVIIDYAQELDKMVHKHGFVGRMGGDNFFLLVENNYFDEFLEKLKNVWITIDVMDEAVKYQVKVRCGISKVDYDTPYRDIVNHTSTALAIAKEKGPDFVVFSNEMQQEFVEEKIIIADFKKGLENNEFIPFYQPKVNAVTGKLCGAEALARWEKDGEIILPFRFVPVLEKSGRITKLDLYLFEKVCKDIRSWLDQGIEPVCISTNFSKLHLKNPDFADEIIRIKNKYSIDSRYIEVELTESSCLEDYELLKEFSGRIRQEGIKIAIDDFGKGYSSLSMLHGFSADVVKIDKSFLDSASDGEENSKVFIRDIISMIENQERQTLCEGVETREQLEFLRNAGCKVIQGYYFDKPLPHNDFESRLKNPQYNIQ